MIEIAKGWYGKLIIHTSLLTVQNIFIYLIATDSIKKNAFPSFHR